MLSTFFQMFIVLGIYNFGQTKKNISDQWCKAILNEEFYDSPAVVIVRRLCLDSTTICTKKMLWNLQPSQPMKLHFSDDFFPSHASKVVQKLAAETIWNSFAAELTMISHGQIGISSFLDSPSNWGDMLTFLIGF